MMPRADVAPRRRATMARRAAPAFNARRTMQQTYETTNTRAYMSQRCHGVSIRGGDSANMARRDAAVRENDVRYVYVCASRYAT